MDPIANFWWSNFINPPTSNNFNYRRLERVFRDLTLFQGSKGKENRVHRLWKSGSENQLTATCWEIFALFNPNDWIPNLFGNMIPENQLNVGITGLKMWYEFEEKIESKKIRIVDIILNLTFNDQSNFLVVIEAKGMNVKLKDKKDIDSSYYLSLKAFDSFLDRKRLIFCIDKAKLSQSLLTFDALNHEKPAIDQFIFWQQLYEIQLSLVGTLNFSESHKRILREAISLHYFRMNVISEINAQLDVEVLKQEFQLIKSQPELEQITLAIQYLLIWRNTHSYSEIWPKSFKKEVTMSGLDSGEFKKNSTQSKRMVRWK